MKKWICALLAAALAALAACAAQGEQEGLWLWFPTSAAVRPTARAVSWEVCDIAAGDATVDSLMDALLAGPETDSLASPFLPNTRVLGWTAEDGLLRLDLSAAYGDLTGVDLTLADCCITLTLCQLEQVEQVCITVNGAPVAGREQQIFRPDDMVFTGAEEEPRQLTAELYFPRAMGKGLGFETRELTLTEDDDLYTMIAEALIAGPDDSDLHTLFLEGISLLGVWTDDGVCYVNFSAEFLTLAPESEQEQNLLLYSVVDTLGNLDAITAVQLLVDGERVPEFGGQDASLPLEPDFGLLSGG